MKFCAICTDERGPFVQRPLGKNDALVAVCRDCEEETPIASDGPDRSYPFAEGMSQQAMNRQLASKPGGQAPLRGRNETMRSRTPGYLLVRVPVRVDGRSRDSIEAARSLSKEPWYADARYLGNSNGFHLFERPDPKAAASARERSTNPLAAIELYRVDGAA